MCSNMDAFLESFKTANIEKKIKNDETLKSFAEKEQKALELTKESVGLIEFRGATNTYWKDLETADIKVMILSIPAGTLIRGAKDLKQELSSKDVNGNFIILDGLLYKSNTTSASIVYMKV